MRTRCGGPTELAASKSTTGPLETIENRSAPPRGATGAEAARSLGGTERRWKALAHDQDLNIIYTYIYVYVHIYPSTIYIHTHAPAHAHTYIYTRIYIHIYIYIYICISVSARVQHTHTPIRSFVRGHQALALLVAGGTPNQIS